jgi:hypothetical protein
MNKLSVQEVLALGFWTEDELLRDSWRAIGALGIHDLASKPDPNWQMST